MFGTLFRGFRSARGIEFLLIAIAVAVLGLMLLNGLLPMQEDARTELERRMENVLGAIEGAGEVRVMVSERTDNAANQYSAHEGEARAVCGVLVVAEGAGDLRVYMEIQRAVRALLDVEASSVEIVGMRGK